MCLCSLNYPSSFIFNLGPIIFSLILKVRQKYLCHWPAPNYQYWGVGGGECVVFLVFMLTKCILYTLWNVYCTHCFICISFNYFQSTPHMLTLFMGRLRCCYCIHDRRESAQLAQRDGKRNEIWNTLTLTLILAPTFTHRVKPRHIITSGE